LGAQAFTTLLVLSLFHPGYAGSTAVIKRFAAYTGMCLMLSANDLQKSTAHHHLSITPFPPSNAPHHCFFFSRMIPPIMIYALLSNH